MVDQEAAVLQVKLEEVEQLIKEQMVVMLLVLQQELVVAEEQVKL